MPIYMTYAIQDHPDSQARAVILTAADASAALAAAKVALGALPNSSQAAALDSAEQWATVLVSDLSGSVLYIDGRICHPSLSGAINRRRKGD